MKTDKASISSRSADFEKHRLIDEHEVSELMAVARRTLARWHCSGKGPNWFKLEGLVRYSLDEVLTYIAERKHSSVRASDGADDLVLLAALPILVDPGHLPAGQNVQRQAIPVANQVTLGFWLQCTDHCVRL
jgi:hypothetical protein